MKFLYYYIHNYLSLKQIKKLNKTLIKGEPFYTKANTIKTSTAFYNPYRSVRHLTPDLEDTAFYVNREAFGFNIDPFLNNNNFIINIYDAKNQGEYEMHTDAESFDRNYTIKLTLLLNLSEQKYEGGEFSLFDNSKLQVVKEFNEPGTLLMFPSYVPHKVSPVTKGQRISGTFFITGPWWK